MREEEASVKLQLFTVQEILNPQPDAAAVVHALLAWIDEADKAAQRGESKPPFCPTTRGGLRVSKSAAHKSLGLTWLATTYQTKI